MNLTPDRQGYLGDIMTKSVSQLHELLDRQKKLLANSKFVERLPDKGEKNKKFVEYVQELIEDRVQATFVEKSENLTLNSDIAQIALYENQKGESSQNTLLTNANSSKNTGPILENNSASIGHSKDFSECDDVVDNIIKDECLAENYDIVLNLEQMTLGSNLDGELKTPNTHLNSYERIVKKTETQPKKTKFLPNRSLKHSEIPKLCEQKKENSSQQEESAVKPPHYKFQEAKIISIEESVELIKTQRTKNELLAAEWAAKRLAEQLAPKMSAYLPSHIDMEYRDTAVTREDEKDSDDEDSQEELE
ncbi:hypothetical protein Btru_026238 [Bulinus truncatus]|nr:hypothetical protein Btru_026238 [Bulinus truncatus]